MTKTIFFDMDGTIADLYGVENWLSMLRAEDTTPYAVAKPLYDMERLSELLIEWQNMGNRVGVISWGSMGATREYNAEIRRVKKQWLRDNLSIEIDEIHIVKYGTPKQKFINSLDDILFDDSDEVLNQWTGEKIDVKENDIIETLLSLLTEDFSDLVR